MFLAWLFGGNWGARAVLFLVTFLPIAFWMRSRQRRWTSDFRSSRQKPGPSPFSRPVARI